MSDPLKVTFKLGERDLAHFRRIMKRAVVAANEQDEADIVSGAFEMIEKARAMKPPAYVLDRLDRLETIVLMTQDTGWSLPKSSKSKILAAVGYFTNPDDLIPDDIPGLGFLDDAIMIELVEQELRIELAGYDEFCRARDREEERPWYTQGRVTRDKRIEVHRKRIREKIRSRMANARDRNQGPRRFKLW
ncbi:MAG: DUF1232 domain-containing protein [bacterium]|nr:DUF1232 domain-containing protein [bacterium]